MAAAFTSTCSPATGDVAEAGDDVAGDRLVTAVLELYPGCPCEVLQAGAAVHARRVARGHVVGTVVLVSDLADELFHQVFEGDDAVGAAVLVHHDGQVHAFLPHRGDRRQDQLASREDQDWSGDVGDASVVRGSDPEQVADVEEPEDVIEAVAAHRVPGVGQVADPLSCLDKAELTGEERHVASRAHDLLHTGLGGGEHVAEDASLLLVERVMGGDQLAQLLL
jgi:hypothetical protein